jgi:hypothetical protein
VDDKKVLTTLTEAGLNIEQLTDPKSPAQMEKVLKKHNVPMPSDLIVSVSSGDTLARVDDPRPASLQVGRHLTAALSKLV